MQLTEGIFESGLQLGLTAYGFSRGMVRRDLFLISFTTASLGVVYAGFMYYKFHASIMAQERERTRNAIEANNARFKARDMGVEFLTGGHVAILRHREGGVLGKVLNTICHPRILGVLARSATVRQIIHAEAGYKRYDLYWGVPYVPEAAFSEGAKIGLLIHAIYSGKTLVLLGTKEPSPKKRLLAYKEHLNLYEPETEAEKNIRLRCHKVLLEPFFNSWALFRYISLKS
jgi:hypothetical protein